MRRSSARRVAGGNATLGQGGTLGGLGHFTVGVRGNVHAGDAPAGRRVPACSTGAPQCRTQHPERRTRWSGCRRSDAAIGMFKGIPARPDERRRRRRCSSARRTCRRIDSNVDARQARRRQRASSASARASASSRNRCSCRASSCRTCVRDLPTTDVSGTTTRRNVGQHHATTKVNTKPWRLVGEQELHLVRPRGGRRPGQVRQSSDVAHVRCRRRPTAAASPIALHISTLDAHELLRRRLAQPAARAIRRGDRPGERRQRDARSTRSRPRASDVARRTARSASALGSSACATARAPAAAARDDASFMRRALDAGASADGDRRRRTRWSAPSSFATA